MGAARPDQRPDLLIGQDLGWEAAAAGAWGGRGPTGAPGATVPGLSAAARVRGTWRGPEGNGAGRSSGIWVLPHRAGLRLPAESVARRAKSPPVPQGGE